MKRFSRTAATERSTKGGARNEEKWEKTEARIGLREHGQENQDRNGSMLIEKKKGKK